MVHLPVRSIIQSLKLVDYLFVQADKTCSIFNSRCSFVLFWYCDSRSIVVKFIEGVIFKTNFEGESISNQPNLFPVEIHLFFFDVIAL